MDALKWIGVAILSLVGGYFGHKITGNWAGGAVASVTAALVLTMIINAQWALALVSLCIGLYGTFSLVGEDIGKLVPQVAPKAGGDAGGGSAGGGAPPGNVKLGPKAPAEKSAEAPQESAGGGNLGTGALKDCPDCPRLVVVPPGSFTMGSTGADPREAPAHPVTVAAFAAGSQAVSKGEFAAFVRATQYKTDAERSGGCFGWIDDRWQNNPAFNRREPGFAQGDDHPVVCVSWNDAQAYVQWLSKTSQRSYRLLSEAEREYAARAGSATPFWWGERLSTDRANYDTTAPDFLGSHKGEWRRATVPANSFEPNPFGLYNVHGNVWEWVQDCQHDNYAGAPSDGSAWVANCSANRRVLRGGGWVGDPASLRASSRSWFAPDFRFHVGGFRVARYLEKGKRPGP